MSLCFDNTSCFDLAVVLFNITGALDLPPNQASFSGYASTWLIGVVVSSLAIICLAVWTAAQARILERLRKQAIEKNGGPRSHVDLSSISAQFTSSSIAVSNRNCSRKVDSDFVLDLKSANPRSDVLSIGFHHLSLVLLHGKGKTVLDNVSGVLEPGTMTAILGPSGCGKTSFLAAIAGRAYYGKMSGSVLINGIEMPISTYRTVVGFVPQEDIMIRTLTVRQVLTFSARMRLPRLMSRQSQNLIVDGIIQSLGLTGVQNQPIGDESLRGISGGQRKRVNIAIELVSAPLALFLDEPTSGLDSSSAYEVVANLVSLMPLNITVAAVMHQPRADLFRLFDRVVLLSNGGHTVYSGKRDLMKPYFERLGFEFDPYLNPADEVLDIISGNRDSESGHIDFAEVWEEFATTEHHKNGKPTLDNQQSLVEFDSAIRSRRAKLAQEEYVVSLPVASPMQEAFAHSESRQNKLITACVSVGIQTVGVVICVVLLCVSFTFPHFVYLRVVVPYCTVFLALFIVTSIAIGAITFRTSTSMTMVEKALYFSAGTVFGPFAVIFCLAWQRRHKYYSYWLFLNMGFGAWMTITFSAAGTLLAMRAKNFSEEWSFTTDVGVCWMLFVCAPLGFVILLASFMRVWRMADSSFREIASFPSQIWLQFSRAIIQVWTRPSALLLDLVLAAVSATMIGVTTPSSSRWTRPVLESLAYAAKGSNLARYDCLPVFPKLLCQLLSVPQSDPLFSNSQFVPLALGLVGVISSLRFFGLNKPNFERENMVAISTTAGYLAKTVLSILLSAASAAVFLSFWGFFVQPPASTGLYFLFIWLCLFSAHGLGILVSVCLRIELAGMIGILAVLIFTLFSTTLSGQGGFQTVVSYFSFISWASVALYTTSVDPFNATLTPWMSNAYGFSPDMTSFSWTQLFCLGIFMRLLAWLALVSKET